MPSADWKVEIVDSSGDADYSVTVIGDQVVDLDGASPGDALVIDGNGFVVPADPYVEKAGDTMTGPLLVPTVTATGSGTGGFTNAGRWLGNRTTAGPPTSGTFVAGDWGLDSLGRMITCTTGGTPGQWVFAGGTLIGSAKTQAAQATITSITDIVGCTKTFTATAQSVWVDLFVGGVTNDTAGSGWQLTLTTEAGASGILANKRNPVVDTASSGEAMDLHYLYEGLTYGTSYTVKGMIARITAGTVAIAAATAPVAASLIAVTAA